MPNDLRLRVGATTAVLPLGGTDQQVADALRRYARSLGIPTDGTPQENLTAILQHWVDDVKRRSAALWTAILGRPKLAQDVTTYLYGRDGVAIVIPTSDAYLDTLLRADQMTATETAALVSLYSAWSASSVAYAVGDIRSYNGTLYRVVQAHVSQANWQPSAVPALWTTCAPAGVVPNWTQPSGQQDSYALDALVTHNTRVWKSLKAANTDQPGAVGTWRDQSNPPMWVAPAGSIGLWQNNDLATHNGSTWRNTSANNSFAPGVFGWVLV